MNPLQLYIHIPFCESKCAYCDFLSMRAEKETKINYCNALLLEIERFRNIAQQYKVTTIFLGGGTPSSLDAELIVQIMEKVYDVFQIHAPQELEITIESNPGTLTKDKLQAYLGIGINRLSMGLQSTDNKELSLLGRIHTYEEFLENYTLAREVGFENINVDLMSALPGQTVESYEMTLQRVIGLQPTHISAYSLIIEEGTPFYNRYSEDTTLLPTEDDDRTMYHVTKQLLKEYGYERYEISNYAKAGYECKHNIGYWTGVAYLGLGVGASSYIDGARYYNETNLKKYMDEVTAQEEIKKEVELLGEKERMEEFVFLGLRLIEGVKKKQFQELFHKDIHQVYGCVIAQFVKQGLLIEEEDWIYLSEAGLDVSNTVMADFLLDE